MTNWDATDWAYVARRVMAACAGVGPDDIKSLSIRERLLKTRNGGSCGLIMAVDRIDHVHRDPWILHLIVEFRNNCGMSVTNDIENIVADATTTYGAATWVVEHYEGHEPPAYDLVSFGADRRPAWQRLVVQP